MACERAQVKVERDGHVSGSCQCEQPAAWVCRVSSTQELKAPTSKPIEVAKPAPTESKPKKASCIALIKYRDTQLVQDFDFAIKHYTAASESLMLLAPLKEQAQDQKAMLPKIDVAIKLSLALQTAANAISDIMGLAPVVKSFPVLAEKFTAEGLTKVADLSVAAITDELNSWLRAEALGLVPVAGSALKATSHFYDNIKALQAAELDGKAIAEENLQNVNNLEKILHKQEAMLKNSEWQKRMLNAVRADIDRTCN